MPTRTLMPVAPVYAQKPILPLARVRLALLAGLPPPESRRTAQLAVVAVLSLSSTRSEQLPFLRVVQSRLALEVVAMPVVEPE